MEAIASVNFLAVLAAAIVSMVVGALWYSPALFAKPWMAARGKTEADFQGDAFKAAAMRGYLGAFIGALVAAFVLALFVKWAFATSIVDGAVVGLLAAIGFVGPAMVSLTLFEDRPSKLFSIGWGYYLVVFTLQGALLAAWP